MQITQNMQYLIFSLSHKAWNARKILEDYAMAFVPDILSSVYESVM